MLASAKLIREVKFTYSVVVAKGKGHGNFFSRLDEQFTLAPTPWDSGKNCFSHVHSSGQGVMIWLEHNEPKTRITNATIRELIIIEELLSLWFLSQAPLWNLNLSHVALCLLDVLNPRRETEYCAQLGYRITSKGFFDKFRGQCVSLCFQLLECKYLTLV